MSPSRGIDIVALSGICGSISIACWVVVFSPQIIENFRRSSADGLSLTFIIIWLLGDIFNILGAILQGVLPTMTILAVYYTIADIILLVQCLYYRSRSRPSAHESAIEDDGEPTEHSSLISPAPPPQQQPSTTRPTITDAETRRRSSRSSFASIRSHLSNPSVSATHLSPATPFLPPPKPTATPPAAETLKPHRSSINAFLFNTTALVVVCGAGVLGWWASNRTWTSHSRSHSDDDAVEAQADPALHFDLWGQIFGYLCAVLYLGSRVPQLLLNFRRKSTEGVSMLFFLFACVGNLTYVLSIFAYEPECASLRGVERSLGGGEGGGCGPGEWKQAYGRYILVNTSWLVGSAGTLLLDLMIFAQFWVYRGRQA